MLFSCSQLCVSHHAKMDWFIATRI
jgi:hypothetical protein